MAKALNKAGAGKASSASVVQANREKLRMLEQLISPEALRALAKDPARLARVSSIAKQLSRDAAFLASVESLLDKRSVARIEKKMAKLDLVSFGWKPTAELVKPHHAAAALLPAAAAVAAAVPAIEGTDSHG